MEKIYFPLILLFVCILLVSTGEPSVTGHVVQVFSVDALRTTKTSQPQTASETLPMQRVPMTTLLCTDTDNGIDITKYGMVSMSTGTTLFRDVCVSATRVREYYCRRDNVASEVFDCQTGTGCSNGFCGPMVTLCGDGIQQGAESCDGTDFGDATCQSYGFYGGNLVCTSTCEVRTQLCVLEEPSCEPGTLPEVGGGSLIFSGSGAHQDEPSGIVWHPGTESLFWVEDDGYLYQMSEEGVLLSSWSLGGRDLEGIALADPTSDYLYLLKEQDPASIVEFNIQTGTIRREFILGSYGTQNGMEALTFYHLDSHPEGGVFFVGDQAGTAGKGTVYVLDLPIISSETSTAWTEITHYDTAYADLADLYFEPRENKLYAVWDNEDKIGRFDVDGTYYLYHADYRSIPGTDQEGITIKDCELYVAEDDAQIFKYLYTTSTGATCHDGQKNQNELCIDIGGLCGFFEYGTEITCSDGKDNDCDGFLDTSDQDCD